MIVARVMPGRTEVRGGVFTMPSRTMKIFSPLASATKPSMSRSRASSYPERRTSWLARIEFT